MTSNSIRVKKIKVKVVLELEYSFCCNIPELQESFRMPEVEWLLLGELCYDWWLSALVDKCPSLAF